MRSGLLWLLRFMDSMAENECRAEEKKSREIGGYKKRKGMMTNGKMMTKPKKFQLLGRKIPNK